MRNLIACILLLAFCVGPGWADGQAEDIATIRERLGKLIPATEPSSIQPAAVQGFYEVMYGAEVLYITGDGRYGLQGDLMDLEAVENLTESARRGFRKKQLEDLDESQMIVFSPEKPRYALTVFTDIDCRYCQKLHAEMNQLNSYGIAVRYMMFPRSGIDTPSYEKAANVWCAADPLTALTRAKAGEQVPEAICDHPVQSQWLSGQQMGVTGTPAMFMEDGTLIQGYRPAKELAATLDSRAEGGNSAP